MFAEGVLPTALIPGGPLRLLCKSPEVQLLLEGLASPRSEQLVYGVAGSVKGLITAALAEGSHRGVLVLTAGLGAAEQLARELVTWLGPARVSLYPPLEVLPYEVTAYSGEVVAQRLAALERLRDEGHVLVTPATALMRRLVPSEVFSRYYHELASGDRCDPQELANSLVEAGYARVDPVDSPGQFGLRGGIVDVFAPGHPQPVRLELFGHEIDGIRAFDPVTQRSTQNLRAVTIPPARELVMDRPTRDAGVARLRADYQAFASSFPGAESRARMQDRVEEVIHRLEADSAGHGAIAYLPYFHPPASLLDYLPPSTFVVLDEIARIASELSDWQRDMRELFAARLEQGALLPGQLAVYHTWPELAAQLKKRHIVHQCLLFKGSPGFTPLKMVGLVSRANQLFWGQWPQLSDEIQSWKAQGRTILLTASNQERAERVAGVLRDAGVESLMPGHHHPPAPGTVSIVPGNLERGFTLPGLGLVVVSDADLYGRTRSRQPQKRTGDRAPALEWLDIKAGDFVVHAHHGIGKYLGVRTLEIEGVQRDYCYIKYAAADALYVPADQIHLIQKYVGAEGHEPKLNRLGGNEWSRVRSRARAAVRKLAQELLGLYALREHSAGHAFGPDTVWQAEFEEAFKFEETPDQLTATREIKRDLERPRIMDRLLCGDVGYGKTEVAMRAAFKAVLDGKQVAVLVPTTILAQQHYQTFGERMQGYPVNVAVLSRFRSPKEQQEVLRKLRAGTVDVVIGTHRLLSADVRFARLGLLIVDEEQRFGVAHKEKIKQMKKAVDVLTLTATPIPRTLHMALAGLRDMSIIDTPPEDRYPVQTFVVPYDDGLVAEAMARELRRGGQVFYVHNRVQSIEKVAFKVGRLLPQGRVAVGHGQMREEHLEKVVVDFLEGKYDVLVSTTIIESGLDMPNVNTLIVDEADRLGLAQLYQLRGRVGRSHRLAYAYFTYRKERLMPETAEKRLQAIVELTELGSGLQLAKRDLEIRGAGNLLGPEQHGFLVTVGFAMYCRLLEEAIQELQGRSVAEERPPVTVELRVNAYLPDTYISDHRQKLEFYKRIATVGSIDEAADIADELTDRFGEMPIPVENLLSVARTKVHAARAGVSALSHAQDRVVFRRPGDGQFEVARLRDGLQPYRQRLLGGTARHPALALKTDGLSGSELISEVERFTGRLAQVLEEHGNVPGPVPKGR
ncbi:MAG TPA: transcription-repair coupling factor [Clostridiales bacterium UBA8153]|nr:transcription-repair coupling factor [Clostridiales bacterium UBA8153]